MREPLISQGDRFGRLVVLSELAERDRRERVYRCLCECGNEKAIPGVRLRNGHTSSCGCLHREVATRTIRQYGHLAITHGLWNHPLYATWRSMHERCGQPNAISYPNYGGRGIYVCKRWSGVPDGFTNFVADIG